ncbi:MAG TPA: hypothetical protein VMF32_04130 [Xanthobacteraceae bacterium]|nr:hypothetical protein [Xanthobacteraceae bacterium]
MAEQEQVQVGFAARVIKFRGWLNRMPPWSSLKALGDNRVLKSSYVWVAIVPLVARVLSDLPKEVRVSLGSHEIALKLGLPFSWTIFFFAAVAASAANLVYMLACPAMVKRYKTYADFRDEGRGPDELKTFFIEMLFRYNRSLSDFDAVNVAAHFVRTYCTGPTGAAAQRKGAAQKRWEAIVCVQHAEVREDRLPDAFWYVRNQADRLAPFWRALCLMLFSVAFIWSFIVLLQNICSVLEVVFPVMTPFCSVIRGV